MTSTATRPTSTRIAAYNEDDVRATLALRDWLVDQRPDRPAVARRACIEPDEPTTPSIDEQVEALHAFDPDTPEHLLGDLLGYWRREWRAHAGAASLARGRRRPDELLDDPDAIAGLEFVRGSADAARHERASRSTCPACAFRSRRRRSTARPREPASRGRSTRPTTGTSGFADGRSTSIVDAGELDAGVERAAPRSSASSRPSSSLNDWVSPEAEARGAVGAGRPSCSTRHDRPPIRSPIALLRRDLPAFVAGQRAGRRRVHRRPRRDLPTGCRTSTAATCRSKGRPAPARPTPGAHIVHALVTAGKRVGITAMSHHAIDNLLQASRRGVRRGRRPRRSLRAVRRPRRARRRRLPASPTSTTTTNVRERPTSTSWPARRGCSPATTCATPRSTCCSSTRPASSASPTRWRRRRRRATSSCSATRCSCRRCRRRSHPDGAGRERARARARRRRTMPPDRGVFLDETRRMHPDVCAFISDADLRGPAHEPRSRAREQATEHGTGLRWLRAAARRLLDRVDRRRPTSSPTQIARPASARPWTDQHGVTPRR